MDVDRSSGDERGEQEREHGATREAAWGQLTVMTQTRTGGIALAFKSNATVRDLKFAIQDAIGLPPDGHPGTG